MGAVNRILWARRREYSRETIVSLKMAATYIIYIHLNYTLLPLTCIMLKCPCNMYPLTPHFYIVKQGFAGVYIIFALKHILWVLVRTATICFEQQYENSQKISTENCHFYSREKLLYIAWACFRNVSVLMLSSPFRPKKKYVCFRLPDLP